MTATPRPATPRLMALARSIGGAVRGLGWKVLDRAVRSIAEPENAIAEAVAAVAMPSMIAFWQRLIGLRAMLVAAARRDASNAQQPAYLRALLKGRVLYLSECVDDWDDGEGRHDSESLAQSPCTPSRIYSGLNCATPGLGAISLWRKNSSLTPKIFRSRICALGRTAP